MTENMQDVENRTTEAAENAAQAAQESAGAADDPAKTTVDQVVEGFEKAGGQVADSARTIWESEQRKEIQDSVVKSLSGVATTIEDQVKKIAENPETQKFVNKMEDVTGRIVEDVTANKAFQDVAEAVMKGLNAAAASIERWLGQQRAASTPTAESPESPAAPKSPDDTETIDIVRDE